MMGYLRLALALLIMLAHLGPHMLTGYLPPVAVLGFYVLAGYTATASVDGPYRGRLGAFMASRIMRLWPSYVVVSVLSLGWLALVGAWGSIGIAAPWRIVPELLMLDQGGVPSPVPTAWVLPWFLLGYVAIALELVATPRRTGLVLIAAVVVAQWFSFESSFTTYYYSPIYAGVGFATGASAYHLGVIVPRDGRWGAWAGALSYPVFLSHYLVGAVIATAYGLDLGWPLFFTSLPPTLALSWLLVVAVERPLARYRARFRHQR